MTQSKSKKQSVLHFVDCDSNKIYGPIPEAIQYLKEIHRKHPKAELSEHWYNYENMELRFEWYEDETDAQYQARLKKEAAERARAQKEQKEREKKEKRRQEYIKLKREFG